jgi:hypothetical protein
MPCFWRFSNSLHEKWHYVKAIGNGFLLKYCVLKAHTFTLVTLAHFSYLNHLLRAFENQTFAG